MHLNIETSTSNTMTNICVIKNLIGFEIWMATSLRKRPRLHDDIRRTTTEKFIIIHTENGCHSFYFKMAEELRNTNVDIYFCLCKTCFVKLWGKTIAYSVQKGLEDSTPKKIFIYKKTILSKDQSYGAAETRSTVSQLNQYRFNFQGRSTLFSLPQLLDLTEDPEKGFGRYAIQ